MTNRTATNHVPSVSTCEMSSLHRTCSEVTSVSSATRKLRRGRSHSIVILALLSQAQVASSPTSMCVVDSQEIDKKSGGSSAGTCMMSRG